MKPAVPLATLTILLALSACQKTETSPEPTAATAADVSALPPADATTAPADGGPTSPPATVGEMTTTPSEGGAMGATPPIETPPTSPAGSPNGTGTGQQGGGPQPK